MVHLPQNLYGSYVGSSVFQIHCVPPRVTLLWRMRHKHIDIPLKSSLGMIVDVYLLPPFSGQASEGSRFL
jgi:hypothetical protein